MALTADKVNREGSPGPTPTSIRDVVVIRGDPVSLNRGLDILEKLTPKELPSWLWWNGEIDEAPELFEKIAEQSRRLIIDTALGDPLMCLKVLS